MFVDIGANIGSYSILLHKNFCEVIVVESYQQNIKTLEQNMKELKIHNVPVVPKAISDKDGVTRLFMGSHCGGNSLVSTGKNSYSFVGTTTFNSLLREGEVVDLIKVDVEGAAWLVLERSEEIVKEVNGWIIKLHDCTRQEELEEWFKRRNYTYRWLDAGHIYAERMD